MRDVLVPAVAKQVTAHERIVALTPWRDFLTDEERATLDEAEVAKAAWLSLNRQRIAITNRAIQRARVARERDDGRRRR